QLIELAVQSLANDVGGKARSCKRVRAAVADLTFADVAGDVSNADLETLRPAPRARAGDCDAVASDFAQRDGRKIGNDVGREIPVRIGYFVEQLLLHRREIDAAAGTRDLSDRRVAVRVDVGERKAEPGNIRNVLSTRIGEVAAADLARALEQMPD